MIVLYFSVIQVGVSAPVFSICAQYMVIWILYLYVQERTLQQLLTVYTFWHGHWMLGQYFFSYFFMMNVFLFGFCFSS